MFVKPLKLVEVAGGRDRALPWEGEDLDGYMIPGSARPIGSGVLGVTWFDLAFHDLCGLDITETDYTELCAGDGGGPPGVNPFGHWRPLKLVEDADGRDDAVPWEGKDLDGYLFPESAVPAGKGLLEVLWFDLAWPDVSSLCMTETEYAEVWVGGDGRA